MTKEGYVTINVDIPEHLQQLMKKAKEKTGITMNKQVEKALRQWLAPHIKYLKKGDFSTLQESYWKE